MQPRAGWPDTEEKLKAIQVELGRQATGIIHTAPWTPRDDPLIAGCFVVFARGQHGRGSRVERAWAAAVVWRPTSIAVSRRGEPYRRSDRALRGSTGASRRARDIVDQIVVTGLVSAPYVPGLLALRQGAILAEALASLDVIPDVVLVDATGVDHPRYAGLAVHLGAVMNLPTIGVTHRPLLGIGDFPMRARGARSPVTLDSRIVGYWICTRRGARPVLAHAGWRTDPSTAADVVLLASTDAARTPVPLQEARRVAREARARAETS